MFTRLIDSLTSTESLSKVFSDENVLWAMLDFEAALARVEAQLGFIDQGAAVAVNNAARPANIDLNELVRLSYRAGTPAIPLVRMLQAKAESAHWGATSQDIIDTALVLLLIQSRKVLEVSHLRLITALRRLSEEHANTVMLARTLMQPAPPITFGLKAALWQGGVERGWSRVSSRFDESAYLQFGGASGTLAAFGDRGLAVSQALAAELGLQCPDAPWHGYRDRIAALMAALTIYAGSLGKMALDIALLMQFEVGEVAEPGSPGRGGSSTMPHKRNPTGCMLAVAAAKRSPGLLANFMGGMLEEHERGLGGWQNEWATAEGIVQAAGVALESMAEVAEGLSVDVARMRSNIEATGGAIYSEKAKLSPKEPKPVKPEEYLGSAEHFRKRLLKEKI